MSPEELLLQMTALQEDTTDYCTIDPETRTISVPPKYQLLGVESDEKVKRIWFQCPKIVDDDVDLSKLGIRVNYQNANGAILPYVVSDTKTEGDNVIFSWLLDRSVTAYKGNVRFIVCATKASGDSITNEWNTTLATSQVLEGLEPDTELSEDETDIVKQLIAIATQRLTDVQLATSDAIEATNNAKTATQEAVNATDDARAVIEQITKDSYLHTALQSFINEATATPTSYGNALVEKIEGYIRQNQPKGYQLFDASKLPSKTQGGATVTNNGDGSFTISGSGNLTERFVVVYAFSAEETKKFLKTGMIYLTQGGDSYPYCLVQLTKSSGTSTWFVLNKSTKQVEITEEMLQDSGCRLFLYLYGDQGQTIKPGTIKPMLYQDGDGTWEPYTGGEPAPSPDYPQVIHGVGDMGFFDGEYQYVCHDNDNTLNDNPEWVSSVNIVPCKTGDNIEIIYARANSKSMYGIIYYKGDKFVSAIAAQTGNGKFTVPSGVDGFQWQVYEGGMRPDPLKVTVTINGMYAICVKSIGKNLIDFDKEYSKYGVNGEYTGNTKDLYTVKIKIPKKYIGKELTFSSLLKLSSPVTYVNVCANINGVKKYGNEVGTTEYELSKMTFTTVSTDDYIFIEYGSLDGIISIKNPQLELGESPTDYIPYQSNTTYIPISSPLFAGDQLIKRNMEHKTYRKMGFAVFDGSEDENWEKSGSNDWTYFVRNLPNCKRKGTAYCNWLENEPETVSKRPSIFIGKDFNVYFAEGQLESDTLESLKVKLAKTPMMLIYELNSQIEVELSPEAQKAIHSIMACDEQTTIEIVGVPTDAEVQNQFLLPRNVDGALNTTAFATSKRNEITLEEQQTATEARLQAIEAQILKEV